MTKKRLCYSKGKNLLQHAHKSHFNGKFVFPAAEARKIARQLKEFYGNAKYTLTENSDPVITAALKQEGILYRTPKEELEFQNATPEERQAVFERHAQREKELIEECKIVDLDAHICKHPPESSDSENEVSKDIALSR